MAELGLIGLAVMGQVRLAFVCIRVVLLCLSSDEGTLHQATRSLKYGCLQNFALNVAEKGFPISVYNRSYEKTELCVARANKEGGDALHKIFHTHLSKSKTAALPGD